MEINSNENNPLKSEGGGNKQNDSSKNINSKNQNEIKDEDLKSQEDNLEKIIKEPSSINLENIENLLKNMKILIESKSPIIGIKYYILIFNVIPQLLKVYIESNLDDDKGIEKQYYLIFEELKKIIFINRSCLIPIYEYFSDIFYNINNIDEKKLLKFSKVHKLWKIFYKKNRENDNKFSTIIFNKGKMRLKQNYEVEKPENIKGKGNKTEIAIHIAFNSQIDIEKNSESKIISIIEGQDKIFEIRFKDITNKGISKIDSIEIQKKKGEKDAEDIINVIINDKIVLSCNINIKMKEFILLEDFVGEVLLITIFFNDFFQNLPFKTIELEVQDLFKVEYLDNCIINYQNYTHNKFNIIDYLGGLKPLIPFVSLINGINEHKNRINKGEKEKYDYLQNFILDIFDIINQYCNNHIEKQYPKSKKYTIFLLYLLFQIDDQLIPSDIESLISSIEKNKENVKKGKEDNNQDRFNGIKSFIEKNDLKVIIKSFINYYQEIHTKKSWLGKVFQKIGKNFLYELIFLFNKYDLNQLYRHYVKELFIYNRYWSNKKLFFENNKNDKLKLKYKQLTYYTRNFQQPILYPILELDRNYPQFSKCTKNIFLKPNENDIKMVNYDFNLKKNKINEIINNHLYKNGEECCLIKKLGHVKGKVNIFSDDKKKTFKIQFIACSEFSNSLCSYFVNPDLNNEYLCLGSIFPFLERDYNKKIIIESNNILFMLIRTYYDKTSGIEIFTYNPYKSYYFNFKKIIKLNNIKKEKNIIINGFNKNNNFILTKIKDKVFLYYNIYYKSIIFPLILNNKISLTEISLYYNNYDLLTIINILSNRSFKDVYQYPVFPMLYKPFCKINNYNKIGKDEIKQERDLSKHIGLQELTKGNVKRVELFLKKDEDEGKAEEEEEEDEFDKTNVLFNTFYSSHSYTANYLMRLIPYCFIAVEIQGKYFDAPDRLDYSIEKFLNSNLTKKNDIRELIPEFYYLPELFFNKNEIYFGKTTSGIDINDMIVIHIDKDKDHCFKYEYVRNLKKDLESKETKLEQWINLIFGTKREKYDDNRYYFNSYSYILDIPDQKIRIKDKNFKFKDDNSFLYYECGISPQLIFDEELKEIKDKSKYFQMIKIFNWKKFELEHKYIEGINYLDSSFQCNSPDIINGFYYCIMNGKKKVSVKGEFKLELSELKECEKQFLQDIKNKNENIKNTIVCFNGNYFGNVSITIKDSNQNIIKEKQLKDHNGKIKFIDYNKRLNLFLTYSSDGFINIYTYPKYKLVSAIKVSVFSKEELVKVVLISSPFPMIFTYNSTKMYTLSINGDLISSNYIKKEIGEIILCIDKDFGIDEDSIYFINEKGDDKIKENILELKNIYEVELPSLLYIQCEKEGKSGYRFY